MSKRSDKREEIAAALRNAPNRSNSWIGREVGASPHTVKKVRLRLEAEGELPAQVTTLGRDGKRRPVVAPSSGDALAWLYQQSDHWPHDPLIVRGEDDDFLKRSRPHHDIILVLPPDGEEQVYLDHGRRLAYHCACLIPLDRLGMLALGREKLHCSLDRVHVLAGTSVCWLLFEKGIRVGRAAIYFSVTG